MLVKDIISKACLFTANEELAYAIADGEELNEEMSDLISKFLKCFNLVRNELASEYNAFLVREKVTSRQGRIELSSLSKKVVNIVSVKDVYGNSTTYKLFDGYIELPSGEYDICYNAQIEDLNLEDEFDSTLPERVYAYGTAREYYFLETLYEDAQIWDDRFKNSLQNLLRKKSETKLPPVRWI